jgi:hypothetical protein
MVSPSAAAAASLACTDKKGKSYTMRLAIAAIFLCLGVVIVEETSMAEQYRGLLSVEVNTAPTQPVVSGSSSKTPMSAFDMAVDKSYKVTFAQLPSMLRKKFDVTTWDKTTAGGLTNKDRTLLAEIYGEADSVFEYGLGESTYIANHVGVPRYSGIDSDATWVANARLTVATHFRFYFADIGETKAWGVPAQKLPKNVLDYQVVPLISEPQPFDVYMVDGRWRLPCLLLSFLHAHARGADPSHTTVLLHDCIEKHLTPETKRAHYLKADDLLDLVKHSGDRLCAYRRKPATTDEELYDLWLQHFDMAG